MVQELPCENGICMVCSVRPQEWHMVRCDSCSGIWHMECLQPPLTVPVASWECPDCTFNPEKSGDKKTVSQESDLVKKIREIEENEALSEEEKARKRQQLMGSGGMSHTPTDCEDELICLFCQDSLERPVTTPCGHNFCLKCLQRWFGQGKKQCGKCRADFDKKFIDQPRINSVLVQAIRMKKASSRGQATVPRTVHYIHNADRPDTAYTTDRAVKNGRANAASGKIFVTVGSDHFGPIPAENDPIRNQGVLVGETWEYRLDCRQWGVHRPHVSGIAGQSKIGAQSIILSGGYEDDEDHGEWFLYTGSGGRDLSGNRRTAQQSFDQEFTKLNQALRLSCLEGYPVRVVRSYKEKRSAYAPQEGLRYDGIYRIEKCWRKFGQQGFRVCRYLFLRCDNEPAPWTSDECGDRPRQLPAVEELKKASNISERKNAPAWDWKNEDVGWGWTRAPPVSRDKDPSGRKPRRKPQKSLVKELRTKFGCGICKDVLEQPLCTPCGHNFCKVCLLEKFAGQTDVRQRGSAQKNLRVQKNIKPCPICKCDISEFMVNPAVNNDMDGIIQSLKNQIMDDDSAQEDDEEEEEGTDPEEGSDMVLLGAAGKRERDTENVKLAGKKAKANGEPYDFDRDRRLSRVEKGQFWTIYDDTDGMPRWYGRVEAVKSEEDIRVRWLEAVRTSDDVGQWLDSGHFVACGKFKLMTSSDSLSLKTFGHQVKPNAVGKSHFELFPRNGEVWAVYHEWSIDVKNFSYLPVEIVSTYTEEHGVAFAKLTKVEGARNMFVNKGGKLETVRGTEMLRFSHKIPAVRQDGRNWELDTEATINLVQEDQVEVTLTGELEEVQAEPELVVIGWASPTQKQASTPLKQEVMILDDN